MQHSKKTPNYIDTDSHEFAVLPHASQEIKETMKYSESFDIRSLKI